MRQLVVGLAAVALLLSRVGHADGVYIFSLAGDKDNFGTGAPLGSPINSGVGTNGVPIQQDPSDGPFDLWKSSGGTWTHSFSIPLDEQVTSVNLTIVTWDLEDGGAGDGNGGEPYDTTLFIDGIEIVGAFDTTFSPDLGPSLPNVTSFSIDAALWNQLDDGVLEIILNSSAGRYGDAISMDYAELTIETTNTAVPEASSIAVWSVLTVCTFGYGRWRKRRSA